jgi:peptidoglycan-associated lipoprotein
MTYRVFVKFSVMVLSVAALTACSHANKTSRASASPYANKVTDAAEQAAQTYAMNGGVPYGQSPKRKPDGELVNALKAPTNQTYYFDFNSNTLHDADYQALTVQAIYLANHPKAKVRLEGNADNRGSREYNIALGWRRDQSVETLLEQQGVSAKQIDKVSYGKERPAVFGNNAYAWKLNRRVNLMYEAY